MQWHLDDLLNADMASEMVLSRLLADENALLSANWYYATELHVFFSQLIFTPLFKVFSDWHTIRMVGSFILYGLLLGSYYYLCVPLGLTKWYPYTAPLLILPVSTLYFQFAVYATPYTFYIAAAFFLLGLMLRFEQAAQRGARMALACGAGILALLMGLNGPRYLMVFAAPMVLAALALVLAERKALFREDRLRLKGNPWVSFFLFSVIICCCAAVGYLLNITVLARQYSFAHYEDIQNAPLSVARLEALLNGWLAGLGYRPAGRFLSLYGIRNVICLGLTGVIFAGIYHVLAHPARYTRAERITVCFFLCARLVFDALYLMTDATYNDRYLLPATVFALPAVSVFLHRAVMNTKWKKVACTALAVSLLFNITLSCHELYQRDDTGELKEIAKVLTEKGYREGYASFWNGNVLTELTDGAVEIRCWGSRGTPDWKDLQHVYPWLQVKTHESTQPGGAFFLLFTREENDRVTIAQRLDAQRIFYLSDEYVIYGYEQYKTLENEVLINTGDDAQTALTTKESK